MGSPFNLIFYATDSATAAALARQSFLLVDSINAVFSDYLPDSELNNLSATSGKDSFVAVSPLLYGIIQTSREAGQKSKGAFDITLGPLSKLWRRARKDKIFPREQEVSKAREAIGFEHIIIDTTSHCIKLEKANMQLDLGGIAKGFAAQQVIQFLTSKGIGSALAAASGDIVCSGAPPGKTGWTVGINLPQSTDSLLPKTVSLQNKAVSTSGDVYQFIEHGGKRYSHIINPATGYGVRSQRNVTVVAGDGTTSDWLATACSILPVNRAKSLVKRHKAALLITELKKGKIRYYTTLGMKSILKKKIT